MTVYIEYAFLENFILDYLLLSLAFLGAKEKTRVFRLCLASSFGGVFAIVYPLLALPYALQIGLKFAVGACMCALAFPKAKNTNARGRYALTLCFFFVLSFVFAGALDFVGANGFYALLGFGFLCIITPIFIKKLYAHRAEKRLIYDCTISYNKRAVRIFAFYDSGNLAAYNGKTVCFLSPDVYFDIFGDELLQKTTGQVCDEIKINTLGGEKILPLHLGEIQIEKKKTQTYFACAPHIVNRAYKLLLNSRIFEEENHVGC